MHLINTNKSEQVIIFLFQLDRRAAAHGLKTPESYNSRREREEMEDSLAFYAPESRFQTDGRG